MGSFTLKKCKSLQHHTFHLVDKSPWPLYMSLGVMVLLLGLVMYMHKQNGGFWTMLFGLFLLLSVAIVWWRDVIWEGTYEGHHTKKVELGLRKGMVYFIISEVMFFFGFFWAFFHSSLVPTIEIGAIWPPLGIIAFNPWEIPLLNTFILLLSGVSITWVHYAILLTNDRKGAIQGFEVTVALAICFTSLQVFEYLEASFSISDGIYGSTFFMATGFHGFHVIVGTLFIIVCFGRLISYQLNDKHHFGFEAAAWYWHFVDVVWLFLFLTIYWWGNI